MVNKKNVFALIYLYRTSSPWCGGAIMAQGTSFGQNYFPQGWSMSNINVFQPEVNEKN